MTIRYTLAFVIEANGSIAIMCQKVLNSVGFEVETFVDGKLVVCGRKLPIDCSL